METKKNNSRQGNKRIALLLVVKALEQMSDERQPIKQVTLAKMVNDIGGTLNLDIWCDRKTIGRHLKMLTAAGYKIVLVKGKGCYLKSNKFNKDEIEIVIRLIRESGLADGRKNQLIAKLIAQQVNLDINTFKENIQNELHGGKTDEYDSEKVARKRKA